ncbi:MAG: hypothetical protein PF439_07060 [Helicobacteraceae bacterium]|jgi:hypothetical protein|nr:hypothetical protein [Helicobacteraceae bacterium]
MNKTVATYTATALAATIFLAYLLWPQNVSTPASQVVVVEEPHNQYENAKITDNISKKPPQTLIKPLSKENLGYKRTETPAEENVTISKEDFLRKVEERKLALLEAKGGKALQHYYEKKEKKAAQKEAQRKSKETKEVYRNELTEWKQALREAQANNDETMILELNQNRPQRPERPR